MYIQGDGTAVLENEGLTEEQWVELKETLSKTKNKPGETTKDRIAGAYFNMCFGAEIKKYFDDRTVSVHGEEYKPEGHFVAV